MIRNHYLLPLVLSLGLFLPGCGSSPPNSYYVLSAHEFATPKRTFFRRLGVQFGNPS